MKRSRHDEKAGPPDEALETRLVNLIVRVGDRDVASQLPSHLDRLAEALEVDLLADEKERAEHVMLVDLVRTPDAPPFDPDDEYLAGMLAPHLAHGSRAFAPPARLTGASFEGSEKPRRRPNHAPATFGS